MKTIQQDLKSITSPWMKQSMWLRIVHWRLMSTFGTVADCVCVCLCICVSVCVCVCVDRRPITLRSLLYLMSSYIVSVSTMTRSTIIYCLLHNMSHVTKPHCQTSRLSNSLTGPSSRQQGQRWSGRCRPCSSQTLAGGRPIKMFWDLLGVSSFFDIFKTRLA